MTNRGRKGKYCPEMVEALCKWVREGNTARDACALEGIAEQTYYRWIDEHCEFSEAIKSAEHECKAKNIAIILKAGEKQWQAAAWWLERKYKSEFALRHEHTGGAGQPITVNTKVPKRKNAS